MIKFKNHNKKALALLQTKNSQVITEKQAIGSTFIPAHKFKTNFLERYEEHVKLNRCEAAIGKQS